MIFDMSRVLDVVERNLHQAARLWFRNLERQAGQSIEMRMEERYFLHLHFE